MKKIDSLHKKIKSNLNESEERSYFEQIENQRKAKIAYEELQNRRGGDLRPLSIFKKTKYELFLFGFSVLGMITIFHFLKTKEYVMPDKAISNNNRYKSYDLIQRKVLKDDGFTKTQIRREIERDLELLLEED
jgi:hypothetical protein